MQHDTAGDPMSGLKWTRKTTEKIAAELQSLELRVSPSTVGRLLREMGFSLRVNHKKRAGASGPDRNQQFEYIARMRDRFTLAGEPIVSADTKKKELVGNFKNPGTAWNKTPHLVNDHDYPSLADGVAHPYGLLDVTANRGSVFVGTSSDTAEFAADALERWWRNDGRRTYPTAKHVLVLVDGGGSNGARNRAWKVFLQEKLCDRHGISVTVCHYPTGTSKWNPVEHRLFSEISKNWAGVPLDSYETILKYIRTTRTATGLRVKACLISKTYETGIKISDAEMATLSLHGHRIQPKRNYTLRPRKNGK